MTTFPKPKRKTDKKFLATFKAMPCLVCGGRPSDPDHIVTRGAGGGDVQGNVWPLCRPHHSERHRRGLTWFIWKYGMPEWIRDYGLTFCETTKRWGRG